jgi:hypothetical protein
MRLVSVLAVLSLGACQNASQSPGNPMEVEERRLALELATRECAKEGKKPASESEAPNAPIAGVVRFPSGAEATWRCI